MQVLHFIPSDEMDEHRPTAKCICAPVFRLIRQGFVVKEAYWEHFSLQGEEKQEPEYL